MFSVRKEALIFVVKMSFSAKIMFNNFLTQKVKKFLFVFNFLEEACFPFFSWNPGLAITNYGPWV